MKGGGEIEEVPDDPVRAGGDCAGGAEPGL